MRINVCKLWLCLPFVVVCLCDFAITLCGQSHAYWSGNYGDVNEVFPVFGWALSKGPWMFGMACLCWMAFFVALIMFLPGIIAECLSLSLVNGHTWGTMTWLAYRVRLNYHFCLLFFAFTAFLFILSHRKWRASRIIAIDASTTSTAMGQATNL